MVVWAKFCPVLTSYLYLFLPTLSFETEIGEGFQMRLQKIFGLCVNLILRQQLFDALPGPHIKVVCLPQPCIGQKKCILRIKKF